MSGQAKARPDAARCILDEDLDRVVASCEGLWSELCGGRLFITGGTGFFGMWILESLARANERLGLGCHAFVLSRNPDAFRSRAHHLAALPSITLQQGDVRDFDFPTGDYTHIIHAASMSDERLGRQDPIGLLETIVLGTRRTLAFAKTCRARKVLFISSGAVYGCYPEELKAVPEDCPTAPDPLSPSSAYAEGKRLAELLCIIHSELDGLEAKIARCFAFVGPHLPLDRHFAVGNFIRDALAGQAIHVRSDGTSVRSYLYASDLMVWLWTILFRGLPGRAYNVGSERAVTVGELAHIVAGHVNPPARVEILGISDRPDARRRYVPCTERARGELGLREEISLETGVARTIEWHARNRGAHGGDSV